MADNSGTWDFSAVRREIDAAIARTRTREKFREDPCSLTPEERRQIRQDSRHIERSRRRNMEPSKRKRTAPRRIPTPKAKPPAGEYIPARRTRAPIAPGDREPKPPSTRTPATIAALQPGPAPPPPSLPCLMAPEAPEPARPPTAAPIIRAPDAPGRRPTVEVTLPDGNVHQLPLGLRRHRKMSNERRWTILMDPTGKILEFRQAPEKPKTAEATAPPPATPPPATPPADQGPSSSGNT
ncbi:uncharacterized protein LOC143266334 [Megachile rotundata]|uniref:uncharacterized protein LOC143266334 n=1 Tax=Megachile rotundata TaxID=143995 RepID=UPI003FD5EE04